MGDRVERVVIVGGGDAGLLTAIGIRQMNPGIDVAVVDDFEREVPRVGKATFREILSLLHGSLEIDEQRFVKEVKPVWKASAYFRDWCGYDSFHYPFDPSTKFPSPNEADTYERYYYWYDELYADPDHRTIGEEIAAQGKSPWYFDPQQGNYDRYDAIAYHVDTDRFNGFLREVCRERGVAMIDDEIVAVETTGNHVDRIRSKQRVYDADLFVDATGFGRLLKGEQDSPFTAFDIPLDSAVATQVDRDLSEIVPATVLDTGDHGWFWHIDTYDHRDLGYVYASEYVSDDEARQTFVDHFDDEAFGPDDVIKYTFDSGYYEQALDDNCLAVGNAMGFVEPLQAPALTTHAKAAVKIGSLLSAHGQLLDDWVRDTYNDWIARSWDSIYDFISVHYVYSQGDNEFWEAMQSIELSPRMTHLLAEFERSGLDRTIDPMADHPEFPSLEIFHPFAFYLIMRNMGAESTFYEENDFTVSEEFAEFRANVDEATAEHVADYLTHEAMYRSVVDAW